jgi:hypothetical protein
MRMYSPKIREDLIPIIYQAARKGRVHMTTFVNRILEKALNGGGELGAKEIVSSSEEFDLQEKNGRDYGEP